jgi:hypothetical protein
VLPGSFSAKANFAEGLMKQPLAIVENLTLRKKKPSQLVFQEGKVLNQNEKD